MSLNAKSIFAALAFVAFSLAAVNSAQADTVFVYTGAGNGTYSGGASGTGLTGGTNSTSPAPVNQAFRELPQGNSVATLTIGGLAPNSSVTINFNLYGIQSLDGNGPAGGNTSTNPDFFSLTANSTTLLNASFANFPGNTQSYPNNLPGGSNAPGTGSSAQNTLGYTFGGGFGDTTYTLSYTAMTNASGLITFTFTGGQNQGPGDESFGIDNITVNGTPAGTPSAVPEPTTMLLLGTGLAGVAAKVSRRRKAAKQ